MKTIATTQGFIDFFYLKRNCKYKYFHINWLYTFTNLKGLQDSNTTTFENSRQHSRRIKYLTEQLPTLEFLKSTQKHIYPSSWKCCRCDIENETFDHIWLCITSLPIIVDIIECTKNFLLHQLTTLQLTPSTALIHYLHTDELWTIASNNNSLTFIDLIKGIIPLSFFNHIQCIINSQKTTFNILSNTTMYLYNRTNHDIWLPRCELMIEKEKTLHISDKQKRKYDRSSTFTFNRYINSSSFSNQPIFTNWIDLVKLSIIHGRDWTLFLDR
jgi:hypothetical protein